jgi:hemolysin D
VTVTILPTLSHYRDVLKASLLLEKQREQSARYYSEKEFLPAALEIMETPASPMARALLLSLCGFVGLALVWSVVGKVDIVTVGSGKIIPEERVKLIQWGGAGGGSDGLTGVVRAIHVSEGQSVKAGQLLVELDPTLSGADTAQATRGLLSAEMERARAYAVSRYLQNGVASYVAPAGAPPEVVAMQKSLLASTLAQYDANRASLQQQRKAAEADLQSAFTEKSKLMETLPLLEQQVEARTSLAEEGYGTKLSMWQIQEQLIERKKNIAIQGSTIARARAGIASIDTQLAQLKQQLAKENYAGLALAEDNASLRTQEQAKATQRQLLTRITAPVDGTVTQLSLHTIGGVIQAAQPLMTIVPKDSALVVEAQVQNKDIGFLKKGLPVSLKLEAYPFTQYGLIEGTLVDISADALLTEATADSKRSEGTSTPAVGLSYTTRIKLDAVSVARFTAHICRAKSSRPVPLELQNPRSTDALICSKTVLSPGMAAQAEIKTGNRRIISYLLSPIARTTSEAGRER